VKKKKAKEAEAKAAEEEEEPDGGAFEEEEHRYGGEDELGSAMERELDATGGEYTELPDFARRLLKASTTSVCQDERELANLRFNAAACTLGARQLARPRHVPWL